MSKSHRVLLPQLLVLILLLALTLTGCAQQSAPAPTPAPAPTTTESSTGAPATPTTSPAPVVTYGAKSAALKTNWTLEEMLQYAIEDEYMARGEYRYVITTFGSQNPFVNIVAAEETHINALKGLYTARNMPVPADNSAQFLIKPANIKDSLSLGVEAEIANINMYKNFLNSPNLPDDVKTVFIQLKAGSESHLNAFQNGLSRY